MGDLLEARRSSLGDTPIVSPAARSVPASPSVPYPGPDVERLACSFANIGPAATEPRTFGLPLCHLQRENDHGPWPVPHQGVYLEQPHQGDNLEKPHQGAYLVNALRRAASPKG